MCIFNVYKVYENVTPNIIFWNNFKRLRSIKKNSLTEQIYEWHFWHKRVHEKTVYQTTLLLVLSFWRNYFVVIYNTFEYSWKKKKKRWREKNQKKERLIMTLINIETAEYAQNPSIHDPQPKNVSAFDETEQIKILPNSNEE